MRWRLAVALALAAALLATALNRPSAPALTTPVDVEALIRLVKSDPALLAAAARFLNETRLNITIPAPPRARPTEIALAVNATEAWAGAPIAVRGNLTSGGRPVPGELVAIYLQGVPAVLARTDFRGRFSAVVPLSVYAPVANLSAVYTPAPGSQYAPARASVQVKVRFNATRLALSAPATVRWGDQLQVEIHQDPPVKRKVAVVVTNGTHSMRLEAVMGAAATLNISTAGLSPGNYTILAAAPPVGPWAPAAAAALVSVTAERPQIVLRAPPVLVAGAPAPVQLHAAPSVPVEVYIQDMPLGRAAPLELPTGPATLRALTRPAPPYAPAQATQQVLVINPLQIAVAAAAIYAAARARPRRRGEAGAVGGEAIEAAAAARRRDLPGEAREALAILAAAFSALGERAGLRYSRNMTYREYAARVEAHARDRACLWRIVELAERAAYSPRAPTGAEMDEARACLERL